MADVKISTVIGRNVFFIGTFNDEWRGNEKFTAMASVWSEAMGIVNGHRQRESEKLKPENVGWAETPSEWSNRIQRTGRDLKAMTKAQARLEGIAASLIEHEKQMPTLRPDRTDLAGAMVRKEIREKLAKLKPSEFVAALHEPDDQVLLAALELPAAVSGTSIEMRRRLEEQAFRRANPPERITELQAMHAALEIAHNAVRAATAATRDGLTVQDQRELAVRSTEKAA